MNENLKSKLDELGHDSSEWVMSDDGQELLQLAFNYGYQSLNIKTIRRKDSYATNANDETVKVASAGEIGLVVQMKDTTYNNGVYILHHTDGHVYLEVVEPDTANKSDLIGKLSADISYYIDGSDTADLSVFNWVELYSKVIGKTVVERIATSMFGDFDNLSTEQRRQFLKEYYPRFLARVAAHYISAYMTDEELKELPPLHEEAVNAEPIAIRMNILSREVSDEETTE